MRDEKLKEEEVYLILDAIDSVRKEFRVAVERGENSLVWGPILLRLVNLYAIIDTKLLRLLIERRDLNKRPFQNQKKSA